METLAESVNGNGHQDGIDPDALVPLEGLLPGEEQADEELIARAVEDLNRIHRESALQLALQMGEYLLATFFAGDLSRFHQRSGSHVSFRRLAASNDLQFSPSFLYTSVAIVEQLEQLPPTLAEQLPLSHHRLLLPVKDPSLKSKLALRAVRSGLSKRELAQEVKAARRRPGLARPGRPVLPETVKRLNQMRRSVNALLEMKASALDFDDYSPRKARELITELMSELEEVSEVLAQLHEKVRARPGRAAARTATTAAGLFS